jgi:hypothetical protein
MDIHKVFDESKDCAVRSLTEIKLALMKDTGILSA